MSDAATVVIGERIIGELARIREALERIADSVPRRRCIQCGAFVARDARACENCKALQ